MTLRWVDGLSVYLYPGNETSECLFKTGSYEPDAMAWLADYLQTGMTFVDVGANMGIFSLFAAGRVGPKGHILAIEPSSRECEQLQSNLELNGLKNIAIAPVAAAASAGESQLRIAEDSRAGHNTLGSFAYPSTKQARIERVLLRPLDELAKEADLSEVHVIKIDVEGAEFAVLQGARQVIEQYRPAILIELFDTALETQGANSAKVWQWLTQRGYHFFELRSESRVPVPARQKKRYEGAPNLLALAKH